MFVVAGTFVPVAAPSKVTTQIVGWPYTSEVLAKVPVTVNAEFVNPVPFDTSIPPNSFPVTVVTPVNSTVDAFTNKAASAPVPV